LCLYFVIYSSSSLHFSPVQSVSLLFHTLLLLLILFSLLSHGLPFSEFSSFRHHTFTIFPFYSPIPSSYLYYSCSSCAAAFPVF
jgi:hypothetical protein